MTSGPSARLDRLLANLGYGSRREVQALAAAGAVTLDGATLRDASGRVAIDSALPDRLHVRGAPVDPPPPLTLVMHKPEGVVCARDETGRSVFELLPDRWRRRRPALSTVGRLDRDTTGLLLITDDGGLLHRIISPRRRAPKRYRVDLAEALQGHEEALFASGGMTLDGEAAPLEPAVLEVLGERSARLTITEGRYHQVKRMFAAVGNGVTALHRDRLGGMDLPADLAPGAWRLIAEDELAAVLASPIAGRPAGWR